MQSKHNMDANVLIILIIFMTILLLCTIVFFVVQSGLLEEFDIGAGKPPIADVKVYYKAGNGSYKDVGPVFSDVTSIAPQKKSFAIYYDDPNMVGTKQRWAVGCILAEGPEETDSTLAEAFGKEGYKPFTFPKVQNVVKTTFPYTSSLSVIVASYRVYPRLGYYVKEKKLCAHPWIEIYDGDTINYMIPLAKQEEFYVPEVLKTKREASERKRKKHRRAENTESRGEKEGSECSDVEHNGSVNIECVPVIECEHSYATVRKDESKDGELVREQRMNSAGEQLVRNHTANGGHNTRSKSVNVLGPKPDSLLRTLKDSKPRSSSATPCKKDSLGEVLLPPIGVSQASGDNLQTKALAPHDRDTGNDSMMTSEDGANSSASSVSSSAETNESSFFSSEFSYSSVDTCISQNTSRYSCDSNQTF